MKMFISRFLCALVVVTPVFAQDSAWVTGLRGAQTLPDGASSGGQDGTPLVTTRPDAPVATGVDTAPTCLSENQKTIPLSMLSSLLRTQGDRVRISHDAPTGTLSFRMGNMISNCNSMFRITHAAPANGVNAHVIEARINDCGADTCLFKVSEKDAEGRVVSKDVTVAPTLDGFQQCLQQTGVATVTGQGASKRVSLNAERIVTDTVESEWKNVSPSGRERVVFGSQRPEVTPMYSAATGLRSPRCYVLEEIEDGGKSIADATTEKNEELRERAGELCRTGDREQMQAFVAQHGLESFGVGAALRRAVENDMKALGTAVKSSGGLADADLSVIDSFQSIVIDPLVTEIRRLYEELQNLPANHPDRRKKQRELNEATAKLAAYKSEPYPTQADVDRLVAAGKFDEAETLNGILLTASNFSRVGGEDRNRRITPRVASENVEDDKEDFSSGLRQKRVDYDVRTGRITGRSQYYTDLANRHKRDIQERTADFAQRIQEQIAAASPGGMCYRMLLSSSIQACIQHAQQCVVRLQQQLAEWNQEDAQIAADLEAKARRYARLEAEGERYSSSGRGDDDRRPASGGQDDLEDAPDRNPTRAVVEPVPGSTGFSFGGQPGQVAPQGAQGGWYGQGGVPGQGIPGQQFGQPQYGQPQFGQQFGQPQFGQQFGQPQFGQQFGQPQFGQQGSFFGASLGQSAGFSYPGAIGQQQGGNWYAGQPGVQGQQFFGQQQPYTGWPQSGYQTMPYIQQGNAFMNPQLQNFGGVAGAQSWYR